MSNSSKNRRKEASAMKKTGHSGEYQYLELLDKILKEGTNKENRTGVDTRAIFGQTMRFDMSEGFPALTTKKLFWVPVVGELLGFLAGYDSAADFRKLGCKIWDANANENQWWLNNPHRTGEDHLGRIYGVQWRRWQGVDGSFYDQIKDVIDKIKNNPTDRRMVVTAWNPAEVAQMALPPCHMFFQFYVADGKLSMSMYQRSCDTFLGVPFNIASYSLLLHLVAHVTKLEPGEFVHILGDTHIYHNHFEQVKEQLQREPFPAPSLWISPEIKDIDDFHKAVTEAIDAGETPTDAIAKVIRLENYKHHPAIKAPMAV